MGGEALFILGVPSSAGAFAAGQERAPAALRGAGLVQRLAAGCDVMDLGDLPEFGWRPDRAQPRAQHASRVAETAGHVRDEVAGRLAAGGRVLVLGGDCTVGVGTVAGSRLTGGRTGLVYLDMHADMNVPSSVVDGALDWMGMAHMLGVEGCLPELADLASPFVPMLDPSQVVVLGHEHSQATDWELSAIAERSLAVVAAEAVRADPAAAAQHALAQLADATRVIVHLDVDVVDFVDAPLSENTGRNVGVTLAAVAAALPVLMADRRTAALTVTELNPVHAAADPGCLERLVDALVAAIVPG
jgi:arginase